jgi:hypothetical protein
VRRHPEQRDSDERGDDPWKRPLQRELERAADPILSGLIHDRIGSETDLARELYLDAGQVRDLAANGMALGGHGRDHPWLEFVGGARIRSEIASSAGFIAPLQAGPWPFAYPYGGVPRGAGSFLRDAGFSAGFTTRAGERHDRYRIGRHDGDELGADARVVVARMGTAGSRPGTAPRPVHENADRQRHADP